MSLKYLNLTGLSRVVTNLKNWVVSQIPTKTSEITNDSGFITSHQSLSNYVTLNSAQTISGAKTFTANVNVPALYGTSASFSYGLDTGCIEMNASQGRSDGGYIDFHYNQSTADFTSRIIENASGQLDINGIKFRSDASYLGVSIEGDTVDLNDLYSTIKGATRIYYATTNGGTNNITNKPVGQAFTLYSHTVRRQSASDYVIEQLAYGGNTIYFRSCTNGTWTAWKQFSTTDHTHSDYVTLSTAQTITNQKIFTVQPAIRNTVYQKGTTPSSDLYTFYEFFDKDTVQTGWMGRVAYANGYDTVTITCSNKFSNGTKSASGSNVYSVLELGLTPTGLAYLNTNAAWMSSVWPMTSNTVDLGTTSLKWRNLFVGETHCYNDNALMAKSGSYTFLLRNDGTHIWFLISEANGNEGTWSGLRPLYINCANGECTSTSKWVFDKSFGDGDPSVLIQSGTAYASGTWNYPLSALAPNMKAGANIFMPIGRSHSTGNCAGWHFYYAGNNSNDNFLSVEFYAAGSPLAVYRDGRVVLSASPAASDNSTRVATTAYVKSQGYLSGTVPIANGGTGATTRLGAVQNLTNEHVGTDTQYFLTITQNWGKAGYCSVADAKTVLGIGTTSKKLTSIGERETEGTWTLTCTTLAPIYFKIVASKTSSTAEFVCGLSSTSSCRFVTDSNNYSSTQIIYTVVRTGSSGEAMWGIGIPTSTSSSVEVFIRNSQYMKTFKITAYQ